MEHAHLGFEYENQVREITENKPSDANVFGTIDEGVIKELEELLKVKNITAIKALAYKLTQNAQTQSTGVKIIELISKFDFRGLESFLGELK